MVWLFFIPFCSYAQEELKILSIDDVNERIQCYTEVFTDSSNTLEINQIASEQFQKKFTKLSDFNEKLSNNNTYWLCFLLDINPAVNFSPGLQISKKNNMVDVFIFSNDSLKRQKTGFLVSGRSNDEIIPYSNIIPIEGSGIIKYYLKIKNINDEPIDLQLRPVNLDKELRKSNLLLIFSAFIQGMIFLMIIYGLFVYFHNIDRIYLYYSLYTLCFFLFYLPYLGHQIVSGLPREFYPYRMVFGYLCYIFYIKFIISFINTAVVLPKWDRLLRIYEVIIGVAMTGDVLFLLMSNRIKIGNLFTDVFFVLSTLIISVFVIRLFFSDIRFSKLIGIGTSFLIIGTLVSAIRYLTVNDDIFIYSRIGTLLELTVFTYGISLKYSLAEREKREYQSRLIEQMKENAILQEKANRELEEKVKQRTAEIAQKNELLQEQNKEIKAQRDLVFQQHKSITESIQYAQKIQSAILPPESYVNELLRENFILFKPRDIVSGDFYWLRQIKHFTVVVAADCTGHGVPGAFMSMLGISFLNEMISRSRFDNAGEFLNRLRNKVKDTLKQKGKEMEQKDGMDMSLAIINNETMELQYAGAFNPLFIIRKTDIALDDHLSELATMKSDKYNLIEVKGDRQPIAIHDNETNFKTNYITLEEGDTIYLFSDGYPDQMGGPRGKKFLIKNFKELLLKIQDEPMIVQKEILENTLEDWKQTIQQIDDILVFGIRW